MFIRNVVSETFISICCRNERCQTHDKVQLAGKDIIKMVALDGALCFLMTVCIYAAGMALATSTYRHERLLNQSNTSL